MVAKFLESVGSEFGKRWVALVMGPATLFWLAGLTAWGIGHDNGFSRIEDYIKTRSDATLIALSVAVIVGVSATGVLVRRLEPLATAWLLGDWPKWLGGLADHRAVAHEYKRLMSRASLAKYEERSPQTRRELEELTRAQVTLHRLPTRLDDVAPTKLGNVLRASEGRARDHYGLDPVVCWPRLWLLLPDPTRTELQVARADMASVVTAMMFSALLVVWVVWTPLALLLAPAGITVTFWALQSPTTTLADLVEACFDVHRRELYDALRWPRPTTPDEEREAGRLITRYLWFGLPGKEPVFVDHEPAVTP